MNKQQFCAMSLPHKLMVYVKYSHSPDNSELETLCGMVDGNIITNQSEEDISPLPISNYGCILHHLSDLTKDEWIEKLNTFACELLDAAHVYDEKNVIGLNWMTHPFEIVMWLIEHHFDIAGLIDKGEAIDVNTLEINPYK